MPNLYTPKQAQTLLEVSATGLRIYTATYPKYLSTEATGKRRKFTEDDLCFLSYVKARTEAGDNHSDVLSALESEEGKAQFAAFKAQWQPLEPPEIEEESESAGTALVPISQLHAARVLLDEAQRREQEAKEEAAAQLKEAQQREQSLTERVESLRQQLGEAQGELKAIKAQKRKPPAWWVKIFGGGENQ